MKIFFDTNVLIDTFSRHDEMSKYSQACYELAASGKIVGYVNAKQLIDFHYILRKITHDKDFCYDAIKTLCEIFKVVPFDKNSLLNSIKRDFNDFEDGTIDDSAYLYCCNFLVTRNVKDYKNSKSNVITPKELISLYNAEVLK